MLGKKQFYQGRRHYQPVSHRQSNIIPGQGMDREWQDVLNANGPLLATDYYEQRGTLKTPSHGNMSH